MRPLATSQDYAHARGDYPALHWVDYCDNNVGLAVANSGTPGHQMVGGEIYISLLRSGTRVADGTMYPQPGAYDNGEHVYEFAFSDHAPDQPERAAWLGGILNRKPVVIRTSGKTSGLFDESIVSFDNPNIIVSSIYPIETGIIARAYEAFGIKTKGAIRCAGNFNWHNADIDGTSQNTRDNSFAPYEIKTFILTRDNT
jgi:alpha-mannosidase